MNVNNDDIKEAELFVIPITLFIVDVTQHWKKYTHSLVRL